MVNGPKSCDTYSSRIKDISVTSFVFFSIIIYINGFLEPHSSICLFLKQVWCYQMFLSTSAPKSDCPPPQEKQWLDHPS